MVQKAYKFNTAHHVIMLPDGNITPRAELKVMPLWSKPVRATVKHPKGADGESTAAFKHLGLG